MAYTNKTEAKLNYIIVKVLNKNRELKKRLKFPKNATSNKMLNFLPFKTFNMHLVS